jgi:GTP pyrophosphokinase
MICDSLKLMNTHRTKDWLETTQEHYPHLNATHLQVACSLITPENATFSYDMATSLLELNADEPLIIAALAFKSAQDLSRNQLRKHFDPVVTKLIMGTHNIQKIEDLSQQANLTREGHADNLRKMLLAMVDDVRVVVLKLMEQLATLRSLREAPPAAQKEAALRVQHMYAPLANRLGIGQIKWQLEDWSFRYLQREKYSELKAALNMRREDREVYVTTVIADITHMMELSDIKQFDITGRAKHIYSIYKKIERKQVGFEEIYDAIALRILVKDIKDCYTVLSIVHSEWEHIPQEFDDYVSKPKPNGYRSIHTAVVGPDKKNIEIQIRTFAMHSEAELGVAAHWLYKEGSGNKGSNYEEKIDWLRQVMAWQQELSETDDNKVQHDTTPSTIFDDRVYVFTPNGDIIDLQAGATPLDFAYHIHSDIGHRCRGGNVNGALVPLTYTLKTGDRVSIQTAKEGKPSRDWLNAESGYIKTHRARTKIAHWFRQENFQQHYEAGLILWDKTWRQKNIDRHSLSKIHAHFNFKSADRLLAAIGANDINPSAIVQYIRAQDKTKNDHLEMADEQPTIKKQKPHKPVHGKSHIHIAGVDNVLTLLAKCCKPIPGDSIIGYITKGRGITVHQTHCHNVLYAQQKEPARLINVSWGADDNHSYSVDLIIHAEDRKGLVRDISNIVLQEKLNLLGMHTHTSKTQGLARIELTLEINNLDPLNKTLSLLRQLPGVDAIERKKS